MSDLKVRLSSSSQNKVVLSDPGTAVTLSTFKQITTTLNELSDVNAGTKPDGAVLVYDSSTNTYKLTDFLVVDGETVTLSGGDF